MLHAAIETRGKSADAFRTISEVASDLDVPQHVLRFWEGRFSQVRPVKRAGGRRYYRPDDVDLLRGIRALLYDDGLTIKGVQKILRDQGVRYVANIGRGEASLLAPRANRKTPNGKSARGVSFEVVQHAEPEEAEAAPAEIEVADLPPPTIRPIQADLLDAIARASESASPSPPDCGSALGPESRARLEIRLAELLELKQKLAEAQAHFSAV
jgi:DNA-binding transcriptional MerR regulator